jgi:hypothetical protein
MDRAMPERVATSSARMVVACMGGNGYGRDNSLTAVF